MFSLNLWNQKLIRMEITSRFPSNKFSFEMKSEKWMLRKFKLFALFVDDCGESKNDVNDFSLRNLSGNIYFNA